MPAAGGASRAVAIDPINAALQALAFRLWRWGRLAELGAPESICSGEAARAQAHFADYLAALAGGAATDEAPPATLEAYKPPDEIDAEILGPDRVLWLDEERLVVRAAAQTTLFAADGRALADWPTTPWAPACVIDGEVICFFDHESMAPDDIAWVSEALVEEADDGMLPNLAIGSADGAWREGAIAAPQLSASVVNGEPEELYLYDERSGEMRQLHYPTDRPRCLATSRDGRFAWVGDAEGQSEILSLPDARVMLRLGSREAPGAAIDVGGRADDDATGAAAIALRSDGWWWLDEAGLLGLDTTPRFAIDGPPARAAGFSPGGDRLALLVDEEVVVLRTDDPAVLARWRAPGA